MKILIPFVALFLSPCYAEHASTNPAGSKAVASRTPAPLTFGQQCHKTVAESAKDAGVVISVSQTDTIGGVWTMTFGRMRFLDKSKKGDPAEAFHNAYTVRISKWATEKGADSNTSESSTDRTRRIKARNGDYVAATYLKPFEGNSHGSVIIVYAVASEFLPRNAEKPDAARQAEQVVPPNGP
jgi:hypothetical protein